VSFVAEFEQALNAGDLDAVVAVYSEDALLSRVNGGNEEVHRGIAEIRSAWAGWLRELGGAEMRKALTSDTGDTITAEWDAGETKGLEYWRFDPDGLVYEHRIYGHEAAEPPESPLDRIRAAAALAVLRHGPGLGPHSGP
jgi:hypothetical protein